MKKEFLFLRKTSGSFGLWNLIYHITEQGFKVFTGAFFIRIIMNGLQKGTKASELFLFLLFSCGIYLFREAYSALYLGYLRPVHQMRITARVREAIYKRAEKTPLEHFESPAFYDSYEKAVKGKEKIVMETIDSVSGLAASVLGAVVLVALFARLDAMMMVFAAFPVTGALYTGKRMNAAVYERDMAGIESQKREKYVARSFVSADYALEMRTTSMYPLLLDYYRAAVGKETEIGKKYGNRLALFAFINMSIGFLIPFLGSCLYLSYRVFVTKSLLVGDFASLSLAILNFAQILLGVVYQYHGMKRNLLFLKNVRSFAETEEAPDMGREVRMAGDSVLSVKNLCYRYPGSEKEALHNISLEIKRGEKVAVVGYNGAGKTTLIHILLKVLPVQEGQVLFLGQDLRELDEEPYQRLWGVVLQDYRLFAMPVSDYLGENGQGERTKEGMSEALLRADLMKETKGEYDRELTKEFAQDGLVLSKGQSQRLAFARFFYRKTEFAVLDEPGSALDPVHEEKLLHEVIEKTPGQTLLLISHRLSCVTRMDRICFMEKGEITEMGTHRELMRLGGSYAKLFAMQASQYETSDERQEGAE
ncbi:MAG: ABC transporter ATP-binding protein [Lachnospiraceae bacterium]|jgi:ATP-binding cassette subfamily B protein|nr:ABC transporter ATP-binding protein [Lachnospiraceae bacterium]